MERCKIVIEYTAALDRWVDEQWHLATGRLLFECRVEYDAPERQRGLDPLRFAAVAPRA